MIVLLRADGSLALEQPADFRRFHCQIEAAVDLVWARAAFARIGELESADVAWVDPEALFALGESSVAAGEAAGWRDRAQAMIDAAAEHGWLRAFPVAIRSHVVWRP